MIEVNNSTKNVLTEPKTIHMVNVDKLSQLLLDKINKYLFPKSRTISILQGRHCHPPMSDDLFLSNEILHGVKHRISLDPSERQKKAWMWQSKVCQRSLLAGLT